MKTCPDQKCTSSSKLDGISLSVKSSDLRETPPQSSAMRIPVSASTIKHLILFYIAGLTYGDPILRTGNPLSVELGPGKWQL